MNPLQQITEASVKTTAGSGFRCATFTSMGGTHMAFVADMKSTLR